MIDTRMIVETKRCDICPSDIDTRIINTKEITKENREIYFTTTDNDFILFP